MALGQGDDKPESAALAGSALNPDFAAHQVDQPLADGQPEPGATILAGHRVVGLLEGIEQPRLRCAFDTDAGIGDREAQLQGVVGLGQRLHTQADRTVVGELDGIADEVDQHLPQTQGVALQEGVGDVFRQFAAQLQAFFLSLVLKHADHTVDTLRQRQWHFFQHHPVSLDSRQIEDVVEHTKQAAGGSFSHVETFLTAGVDHAPLGHVDHAHDAVHRRPQFVAHVGKKGTLGAVGGFGGHFGVNQVFGALLHQFFKMIAVLPQFIFRQLAGGDVGVRAAHAERFALRVALHDARLIKNPDHAPILAEHPVFEVMHVGITVEYRLDRVPSPFAVIRVDEVGPLLRRVFDLGMAVTQHRCPAFIPVDGTGGNVPVPKSELGTGQHEAQLFLAVCQRLTGKHSFRNVLNHGNDVIQTTIRLADVADGQSRRYRVAVLVNEALVHGITGDLAGQHAVELLQVRRQIIRMRQLRPGHPGEFLA